jgi:hypothetical protein
LRILSFDPGGTTGWAFHSLYHGELTGGPLIEGGQIGPNPHHRELWQLIYDKNPDVIVFEDFQYRVQRDNTGSIRMDVVLTSVEYIGVIKLAATVKLGRVTLISQLPVAGKSFFINDKLKRLGVHTPGRPHQNDATRHLLHYVVFGLKRNDYLHAFKPAKA